MVSTALDQDAATLRRRMVDSQLRCQDVTNLEVLAAFLATPREPFVAPAKARFAYLDGELPSAGAPARKLLAPAVLARLIQAAEVKPGERVLDVGGGAGYGAAILDRLGAEVTAIESEPGAVAAARKLLADRPGIEVVEGDLAAAAKSRGPFDVIVIEGAFEVFPEALFAELAQTGRLVGIDARAGAAEAALIERTPNGAGRRALFEAAAPILESFRRVPGFTF